MVRSLAGEISASGYLGSARVRDVAIQAGRRLPLERLGEQVHLPVRGAREDVHELHRGQAEGRLGPPTRPQRLAQSRPGRPSITRSSVSSSPCGPSSPSRFKAVDSWPKTSAFGRASPCRVHYGAHHLQADGAVAAGEVVVLEERGRGQHDVGVERGVGHHLVEHDGEEVLALEPLAARASDRASSPPGCSCRRTAPSRADRQLGERPAQLVHVDHRASAARPRPIQPRVIDQAAELLIV